MDNRNTRNTPSKFGHGLAADRLKLAQVAELGADRYQVDRLAAAMQPAHSAPDVAMMVPKPIAVFREQR